MPLHMERQVVTRRKAPRRSVGHARFKGIALLLVSFSLLLYALPCFAASIWDEGLPSQGGGTLFANPVKDDSYSAEPDAVAPVEQSAAASSMRAASKVNASVTETTGPGIASDESAVSSAKKRVQAVSAAQEERNAVISAITVDRSPHQDRTLDLLSASFALAVGFLCALLGCRFIISARRLRADRASVSYSNALKA